MTRAIFRLGALLAAVAIIAHCATTEPYPEDWSSPVTLEAGECADISGTFSNACTPKDKYDSDCLDAGGLAGLLLAKYAGSYHTKLGLADRVVISQPTPSGLHIEAWNGEEFVQKEEIRLNSEDCTEAGILIRTGLKGTQIEGGIGTGSSQALLSTSEDGNLIAWTRVKFTGVWFVVPVSGSSQHWDLFERLPDLEEESPELGSSPSRTKKLAKGGGEHS